MKFSIIPLVLLSAACSSHPGPVVPETKVERQMIGLMEKFDRYDLDGNGQLDATELLAAQKATGHPPAEIIDFYDQNKNGTISLREAHKGYSRKDEAEKKADHTH